jgi:hypothetical protein
VNPTTTAVARPFIVMTGLPASGKTTLGRAVAGELVLPLVDKDEILVSLFETQGVNSPQERSRLSRASDQVLEHAVRESNGAVIASFWRRDELSKTSGTPTGWLADLPSSLVVEVWCECSPTVAADRFRSRVHHPGHFDSRSEPAELLRGFERLAESGPVTRGPLVRVSTETPVDVLAVCSQIRTLLQR